MTTYKNGNETRENIVEATGLLAAERGLDNFTVRQVAARAEVNIGSIHYHFGGKEALQIAVMEELTPSWIERPLEAVLEPYWAGVGTDEGKRQLLRVLVHRHMEIFKRKSVPTWHNRVMYQVLQHQTALTEIVERDVIRPGMCTLNKVMQALKPGLSVEEQQYFKTQLLAPICFHCDYPDVLLRNLHADAYSKKYLAGLEKLIVQNLAHALGI